MVFFYSMPRDVDDGSTVLKEPKTEFSDFGYSRIPSSMSSLKNFFETTSRGQVSDEIDHPTMDDDPHEIPDKQVL